MRYIVTSALPYANGPLHLGHAIGAYIPADIYARYRRMKGDKILFICGTDEHGTPIAVQAEKEGITPKELVDELVDYEFNSTTYKIPKRYGELLEFNYGKEWKMPQKNWNGNVDTFRSIKKD